MFLLLCTDPRGPKQHLHLPEELCHRHCNRWAGSDAGGDSSNPDSAGAQTAQERRLHYWQLHLQRPVHQHRVQPQQLILMLALTLLSAPEGRCDGPLMWTCHTHWWHLSTPSWRLSSRDTKSLAVLLDYLTGGWWTVRRPHVVVHPVFNQINKMK